MTGRLLRVVIDINVLVSAYFFSKSETTPPRQILRALLDRRFELLHTPEYLIDLAQAFNKDRFVVRLTQLGQTPFSLTAVIAQIGVAVPAADVPLSAVRDRDDRTILACAVGGSADFIVSGDRDLTVLETYRSIPILTPAQFLTHIDLT